MARTLSLDLTGRSLLGVFAHPDDESLASGGLLASCAERGAHVSVLCLTHGDPDQDANPGRLGHARAEELRAAAGVLGLDDVILLNHVDGMLPWTDAGALETDIGAAIQRLRPDAVVTFGEDGLYWHPDHIAVHERTTASIRRMAAPRPALYYVSVPIGHMRHLCNHVLASADPVTSAEISPDVLGVEDVDAFGTMAEAPTLVFEAGELARRKLAAIRCHATQVADGVLSQLGEQDAARFLGTEYYRRATTGSTQTCFIDQLVSQRPS